MKNKEGKIRTIERHSLLVRLEHWLIALSGLALFFSGFGQFPLYRRYMVDKLPGLAWPSDFGLQLKIHYLAAIVFTATVIFHLTYHWLRCEKALLTRNGDFKESWQIIRAIFGKGVEPSSDKFLAEQRLAYVFFGGTIFLLIATGLLKTAKNLLGLSFWSWVVTANTMLHNLATILFIGALAAHLGALLRKTNWPMLWSMFTGRVGAAYAGRRHPLWGAVNAREAEPVSELTVDDEEKASVFLQDEETEEAKAFLACGNWQKAFR